MRVLNGALIGVIVAVLGFTMTTAADPDTLPKQSAPNPESSTDAETDTWKSLFDGKTLGLWKPTRFGGEGEVSIQLLAPAQALIAVQTGWLRHFSTRSSTPAPSTMWQVLEGQS